VAPGVGLEFKPQYPKQNKTKQKQIQMINFKNITGIL
jgi:hypothetical protein